MIYRVGQNNNKIQNSLSRRHNLIFDVYKFVNNTNIKIEDSFSRKDFLCKSNLLHHSIFNYDERFNTMIDIQFVCGKIKLYSGDGVIVNNADIYLAKLEVGTPIYWLKFADYESGLRTYKVEDTEL